MPAFSRYFLSMAIILLSIETNARSIWAEPFAVPDKGYWGDADGTTVHRDFSGIENWSLNADACVLLAANDYVKTVATSGGRLEAMDCNGEAVWRSVWVKVDGYDAVRISLVTRETGSGSNLANKYIHVFYRLNGGEERLLEGNGKSAGNWGEAAVSQENLHADSLQIVIRMNTTYASDKIIVDDILVESVDPPLLPENLASAGDLLINEVLFNPYPGGYDFVELANVSEKSLRLDHLFVASRDSHGELKQLAPLCVFADYLAPGSLLLISENTDSLAVVYPVSCPENFVVTILPTFADDAGVVVLLDDSARVIDEFAYTADMHHPMLAAEEGVSLERVSLDTPSIDRSNWTSAAAIAGFATPGCPNSAAGEPDRQQPRVAVEPVAISPNNDGYNDVANIRIELPDAGWLFTWRIFDANGHQLELHINNATCGLSASLPWDGRLLSGTLLPAGIYIFSLDLTNPDGRHHVFRKTCTIVPQIM